MPSDPELKELHREMLVLLKRFHKICTSNGIHYSLHGGTLLGAVREKGFIPWDNDVDTALMRTDYERFRNVMLNGESVDGVTFDDRHRVPRLILNDSGIFLDLFIYDPISENAIGKKFKAFGNLFLRTLIEDRINLEAAKKRNRYHKWLYWGYDFMQKPGSLLPPGYALKKFNQFNQNRLCGSGKMIFRSNDGYPGMIIFLPAEVMSRYEMTKFEDTELMISSAYPVILSTSYGEDYMTPKKCEAVDVEAHEIMMENFRNQIKDGEGL